MEILSKEEWLKKKRHQRRITAYAIFGIAGILIIILLILLIQSIADLFSDSSSTPEPSNPTEISSTPIGEPDGAGEASEISRDLLAGVQIEENFLRPNEYSRPQIALEKVTAIAIHYVGNPGTTAKANRNYFDSLADSKAASSSSHYVIGLEGEIIQCIPLDEISYATKQANYYSISIECCHPDSTGRFNKKTYQSLVKLTAWLCDQYDLDEDAIIRHYDVTAKECPLYYVKNEDAWNQFKDDVMAYLNDGTEPGESL